MTTALEARQLGARGSRLALGDGDPATTCSPEVAAVLAAIPAWWAARAHTAGLTGEWLDVEAAINTTAPVAVPATSRSEAITDATTPHEVGACYTAALTPGVRSRHGRHYTPADLAEHMWAMTRRALGFKQSRRALPGLVLDPAAGAGALLLPVLREHLTGSRRADPRFTLRTVSNLICGVDADPVAVWLANVVLAAEMLPLLEQVPPAARQPLPALVSVGDGLDITRGSARAVVMNPPYGRVRLAADDRERFAPFLHGHANLYALFLAAGVEALNGEGVLTALVPTSFTAGRYFSGVRGQLAATAPLRDLTFVAERDGVFAGVLQETCLATFTRTKARKTTIATINGRVSPVASVPSPRTDGPWLLPRRADDAALAAGAVSLPLTLADTGWRVSTGPLVWNRRREDLTARKPAQGHLVLWAADIDGGAVHRDRARSTLRWLRSAGVADDDVMTLREPAILVQRTTAPEQTRRLVVAELSEDTLEKWGGAVVVENHVNVLRPAAGEDQLISREALARLLTTPTLDRVVRCISGSVALSAYELRAMPLPAAEVLRRWERFDAGDLEAAVAATYRSVHA